MEGEFARLLEKSFKRLNNEIITGTVVKVTDREAFIDFGWKSEGIVPLKELGYKPKIGEEIDVCVVEPETEEGYALLSVNCARSIKEWEKIASDLEKKGVIRGRIKQRVRGGYKVAISQGITVFLPMSQVDIMPVTKPDDWLDREIEAKVLSVDRKRRSIVISRRKLLEEKRAKMRKETLEKLKEGDVVEGIVKNVVDFGIFVDVQGVDGLVHKSDISWSGLKTPFDTAEIGDRIKVKIKKIDREKERLVLSIKDISEDPWLEVNKRYKVGTLVKGIIVREDKSGYWIELPDDIAGYVPVDTLPKGIKLKYHHKYRFMVDRIDEEKRRVILKWQEERQK
ncbi:RNA binding S1 domain protein [Desulfurobacterium thermolithotrophum DSM 11699]|uniref:RNA binding S1 domain protein n=1 Tax=Desulfurobacterium thermolithotrophum (strain DSM 11699 / BSA) TaxID=868864 RepID=F0S0G6_DESTD|nr:S1 RNA-binding domain-containing protein [Desulfurobacterium thermolithotrophum]ADY72694.1 RNA binding S1 domain protein [Desulfurobacterium thermolithotrophum DSM 11699]